MNKWSFIDFWEALFIYISCKSRPVLLLSGNFTASFSPREILNQQRLLGLQLNVVPLAANRFAPEKPSFLPRHCDVPMISLHMLVLSCAAGVCFLLTYWISPQGFFIRGHGAFGQRAQHLWQAIRDDWSSEADWPPVWDVRKSHWEIHQAALGKKRTPKRTSAVPCLSGSLQGKMSFVHAQTAWGSEVLLLPLSPLFPIAFSWWIFPSSLFKKLWSVACFLCPMGWFGNRRQLTEIWNCSCVLEV